MKNLIQYLRKKIVKKNSVCGDTGLRKIWVILKNAYKKFYGPGNTGFVNI